jgi:hypothetical protein
MNALRDWGTDCKDTVAATAQRKALYKKQYEAAHEGPLQRAWHSFWGRKD